MKKIQFYTRKVKGVMTGIGVAATTALLTSPAHAALDLSGVTVDTTDYITIATFLIGALVTFWGIKKGLSLFGR